MFPILFSIIILFFLSSLVVAFAVRRAPAGYQDADGFHLGIRGRSIAGEDKKPVGIAGAGAPAMAGYGAGTLRTARELTLVV